MDSITCGVPETLRRERKVLEDTCNLLIKVFNERCEKENKKLKEERQARLKARVFRYSIKTIDDNWRILYKEAINPIKYELNQGWSRPFKIINGVLIHADHMYKSAAWQTATDRIPQGLFDEATLETINRDW